MDKINKKLTLLSHVAKELNNRKVTWAIGASMLLYFKGIVSDFHDIDILVKEEDIDQAKEALLSFGIMQSPNQSISYKTKQFMEFEVDGVEFDLMAGFVIINNDKEYYFALQNEDIKDFVEVRGVQIPLQSLEEWRMYYQLMGRDEKVRLIDDWQQRQ